MAVDRAIRALSFAPVDRIPLYTIPGGGLQNTYVKDKDDRFAAYRIFDVDLISTLGVREKTTKKDAGGNVGFFKDFEDNFQYTDLFPLAYKGLRLKRTESATQLWVVERPFKTYSELVTYLKKDFDPIGWEHRSKSELVENYTYSHRKMQDPLKEVTLVAGQVYLTLFTFFLIHLGHKLALLLLQRDPELFMECAEKYVEVSRMHVEAWSRVGIRAFISHDDIALRDGPMMSPRIFREYVAPLYKKIWKPIREKGIKIIFISDGDFVPLVDYLLEQGAEGFKVNWDARLNRSRVEELFRKYGGRQVLSLGPSNLTLTWGSLEEAIDEAVWLSNLAKEVRGFFLSNVEGENSRVKVFWETWTQRAILSPA